MNQQDMGRLAIGVILGVVSAVVVTKSGLSPREAVLRWLIFALVTGILVNTQEGKGVAYLLAGAVLSAFSLVATVLFLALLGEGVIPALSGVKVNLINRLPFAVALLPGLWFASALAVLVCAFSRPVTLGLLHNVVSLDLEKAKKIESLLNILVSIAGTSALLIFSIV